MATNAVLRAFVAGGAIADPATTGDTPPVRATFIPLPSLRTKAGIDGDGGLQLLVLPLLGAFMAPSLLSLLIEEKQSGLFFAMRMQGVTLPAYWAGMYAYCMVVLGLIDAVIVGFAYLVGLATFKAVHVLISAIYFLCFSHAMTGFVFLASGLFRNKRVVSVVAVRAPRVPARVVATPC